MRVGDGGSTCRVVGESPLQALPRSAVGTNIVPRKSATPSGYWWVSPMTCRTRSRGSRLISASRLLPWMSVPSSPRMCRSTDDASSDSTVNPSQRRTGGSTGRSRSSALASLASPSRSAPATFEVAQVHVVAEGRADDPTVRGDHEDGLRLGVVPGGRSADPDPVARPDRGQHRRLREHLRIRPDGDLEVLRPESVLDESGLEAASPVAARSDGAQVLADRVAEPVAEALHLAHLPAGAFLDDPFDGADGERDAARLDDLEVDGAQPPRGVPPRLVWARPADDLVEIGDARQARIRHDPHEVRSLEQVRHRRGPARQVEQAAIADGDRRRAADARPVARRGQPHPPECDPLGSRIRPQWVGRRGCTRRPAAHGAMPRSARNA